MSRLLTITEASEITRLSTKTLYSYVCARKVPYCKLGGKLLFDEEQLKSWISAHFVAAVRVPAAVAG